MIHSKFPDLTNHLDAAFDIAAEIIAARAQDSTADDFNDMHSARLCIETAVQLVLGADSRNREGLTWQSLSR